jgi:hypothetical protein
VRDALAYADAGVDIVAPSGMMDGQVAAIRRGLDEAGHEQVALVAYAAKYASAFYGPFREAAESAMAGGDRASHQMDPANRREARRELALDELEGADALMVKPALPYLDVLADARARFDLPLVAYHVSGEYAMVHAAAERGWLDGPAAMREAVLSIHRAGRGRRADLRRPRPRGGGPLIPRPRPGCWTRRWPTAACTARACRRTRGGVRRRRRGGLRGRARRAADPRRVPVVLHDARSSARPGSRRAGLGADHASSHRRAAPARHRRAGADPAAGLGGWSRAGSR